MYKKAIGAILMFVLFVCVFAIFFPYLLLWFTEPFPRRLIFSVLFSLIALEKNIQTFLRLKTRRLLNRGQDFTTITIGLSYPAVIYLALIEFYLKEGNPFYPLVTIVGLTFLGGGIFIRYWSFHCLGQQWSLHVDAGPECERSVITHGPYRYMRHPIYSGAILEAVGIALTFNAFGALALGLLTFVPLEIHRAYFEEKFLYRTFGNDYRRYAARTWAFAPLPFSKPAVKEKEACRDS